LSVSWLADEDLDNDILRGVRRRSSEIDIQRVQDVGLAGKSDSEVLVWAAAADRVVLTHDINTFLAEARRLVRSGQPMAGVIAVSRRAAIGRVIEDIILCSGGSLDGEWEGKTGFIPL